MTAPVLQPADRDALFPVLRPPLRDPNELNKPPLFEVGLVLGGTVSAGAYTAGVLDFLFEAFDAWALAKDAALRGGPKAPMHDVVISVIGGTSGGAVNGALAVRLANSAFSRAPTANPFRQVWTEGIGLKQLLDAPKDEPEPLGSLLSTQVLDDKAKWVIDLPVTPLDQLAPGYRRRWLADPLRLIMTAGNVTGIPYRIPFKGGSGLAHDLLLHEDLTRFALNVPGGTPSTPAVRRDELALSTDTALNWDALKAGALATCAFPLAFRPRPITRNLDALLGRAIVIPNEQGGVTVEPLAPAWDRLAPGSTYRTLNVDGGTFNNEPIEHVRRALAGYAGRNPRDGTGRRAVILIDPFSDPLDLGPVDPPALYKLVMPLIGAWKDQARYKPEDIALAQQEDVYSRYMVAPIRGADLPDAVAGSRAIAAGGLGGFLGFLDPAFLEHDFALGRRNAWQMLRHDFALPEYVGAAINPMFADPHWDAALRQQFRVTDSKGNGYLPLVPLVGSLASTPPPVPSFASLKLPALPDWLEKSLNRRLDHVFDALRRDAGLPAIVNPAWRFFLRGKIRDFILKQIKQGLAAHGLG